MSLRNLNSFTQSKQLMAITLILASQPNIKWIEKLETNDQLRSWLRCKRRFLLVAECWASRYTFQDDPLRPLLKAGEISRNEYNLLWSTQTYFERLWALCQHVEPFIQEAYEQAKVKYPYPFANAFHLFTQITEEMVSSRFALCLEPYVERSSPEREKALRLKIKAIKGFQLTKAQEKVIEGQSRECLLADFLEEVAQKVARKELVIRHALEDYQTASLRLLKCFATECHNQGSHAWSNGRVVKGSKSGYPYKSLTFLHNLTDFVFFSSGYAFIVSS